MKKILLIIITILLMLPLVKASFIGEWGEVQDNSWRTGFVNDAEGIWNNSGITITSSYSSMYQPIIADVNNDSQLEILIGEGNYVTIQYYDDYSIDLLDELDMGSAQSSTYNLLESYDTDDYVEFVVVHTTNFSVLEFNGTNINIECSLSIPPPVQGVACHNKTNITCYTFDAVGNMSVIDTQACTLNIVDIDSGTDIFTLNDPVQKTPIIADLDRDGFDELILGGDQGNNVHEGIYVIDTNSLSLDTGFNGGGYLQLPEANSGKAAFSGVTYWNLGADNELWQQCVDECAEAYPLGGTNLGFILGQNIPYNLCLSICERAYEFNTYGGGYGELIVTSRNQVSTSTMADYSYISAYRNSGTAIFNLVLGSDGSSSSVEYVGNPVIMIGQLSDEHDDEICTVRYRSGTIPHTYISCVNELGTLIFQDELDVVLNPEADEYYTTTARLGGSMDLMLGGFIFLMDYETNTTTMINATTSGGACVLNDINRDNTLDVACATASALSIGLNNYVNEPPQINTSLAYGGYGYNYDITRPICLNQTITFTAQEIGGINTGNYENDIELDLERIVSNCGKLSSGVATSDNTVDLQNGSYVGSRPVFECYYNVTGTYPVTLFLEDLANIDDRTQYNTQTISLQVIDGELGVDCSFVEVVEVGTVPVLSDPADDANFDNDVDAFFDGIHLTSPKARNLLGMMIICLIGAGIFMKSRSIELSLGGAWIGGIMMLVMGILSILPFVLITVLAVVFVVMKVLGRGG